MNSPSECAAAPRHPRIEARSPKMKLGMFMMPLHPPGRNATETLAEDREAFLLADRLGFADGFVGEHVPDVAENVTSCLMFLASLAHETKNIVLGSGTINMPNSHPAAIAAQVAMLDHILKGRFIMGISPGGLMSDAEVFGNFQKNRNAMFVESINTVLKIWESEGPLDLQGEFFKVSTKQTAIPDIGQGMILKPYQRPHPRIVGTAVAPFSAGVTEMAKRGWQPISANFLMPPWVKSHWPKYVEGREAVGAKADPSEWRVAKSVFVADHEKTAQRYGKSAEGPENAPAVVLVHGILADHRVWDAVAQRLSPRYRVVRYDVRGHGGSSAPPGPYTMEQLADDVPAILDALGIAKAHFAGSSMGG